MKNNHLLLIRRRKAIDFDFRKLFLPNNTSFIHASAGTYSDKNCILQSAVINAPRFDHHPVTGKELGLLVEGEGTNLIKNNTMVGAVAGSPGTLPTNWSAPSNGLSFTIVETGISKGINYIDVRFSGTTTGYYAFVFFQNAGGHILVDPESDIAESAYISLVDGSLSSIKNIKLGNSEFNSVGSYITDKNTEINVTGTFERYLYVSHTSATAYRISPYVAMHTSIGAVIDATFRVGVPQVEVGNNATSIIPTSGGTVTRAPDQLSITIPNGVSLLRYVFDDDSTQDVAVSAGPYSVPTSLNRAHIKKIRSMS